MIDDLGWGTVDFSGDISAGFGGILLEKALKRRALSSAYGDPVTPPRNSYEIRV